MRVRSDIAIVATIAVAVLALHLDFCWRDPRPAVDLGHYYADAVDIVRGGEHGHVEWQRAPIPYDKLLALAWLVFGRSQGILEGLDGAWLVALTIGLGLCGVAVAGRGGAWAALGALVLPIFPMSARVHFIHNAEVGLGTLAFGLAATLAPGALTGACVGLTLGLGVSVRQSAPFWLLVPLVVWLVRARGNRMAMGLAALPYALGAASLLPLVPEYLKMRLAGRAGSASAVGDPLPLLVVQTGRLGGAVAVALAGVALVAWGRERRWDPARLGVLAWGFGGVLAVVVTRVGPDNLETMFAALAVLAASGAASLPGRARVAVGALVPLLVVGPLVQVVPAFAVAWPITGWDATDGPLAWTVPSPSAPTSATIVAAVRSVCPAGHPCVIAFERGLVAPTWEDDGSLELFLAHVDHVEVRMITHATDSPVDAAVTLACQAHIPDADARYPGVEAGFHALLTTMHAKTTVYGQGCTWTWYGK